MSKQLTKGQSLVSHLKHTAIPRPATFHACFFYISVVSLRSDPKVLDRTKEKEKNLLTLNM